MPEIPDIELYLHALDNFVVNHEIKNVIVKSPFVVRTFEPPIEEIVGRKVVRVFRLGKQILWKLQADGNGLESYLIFHLMIAGRFHWRNVSALPKSKNDLAVFQLDHGSLLMTEASQKKRASIHLVEGAECLDPFDRDGLEVQSASFEEFRARLQSTKRTVKRALCDPNIFSGIGNAYSDEILIAAGISPFQQAGKLDESQSKRLYENCIKTLTAWTDKLIEETGDRFPKKVTAFRPEMLAHGKFGQSCQICGNQIQRVRYSSNEMNYCPGCQTGGKILADRSLSRLLKDDWPKSIEDLDE